MGRVVWDPDWPARAELAIREFQDKVIGPDVAADARMYCPEDEGWLADSIRHEMEDGTTVIVEAGPWEPGLHGHEGVNPYAAYVELGHQNFRDARGTFRMMNDPRAVSPAYFPPQPFLRPALYTERLP